MPHQDIPFRFLDLSAELRLKIYDYYAPDGIIRVHSWGSTPFQHALNLSHVNRQIREEALHHYFGPKTIAINVDDLSPFCKAFGSSIGMLLKRLSLRGLWYPILKNSLLPRRDSCLMVHPIYIGGLRMFVEGFRNIKHVTIESPVTGAWHERVDIVPELQKLRGLASFTIIPSTVDLWVIVGAEPREAVKWIELTKGLEEDIRRQVLA
ncbi:hypothetical protein NA57DRAFT_53563 [Rhizodiscina lignyota]|uniref:F-box domain-containing protein n=1 Tax=Rhizodiscina lignyota TaxID=1504668 RepID=A0A9P4IIA3_9PEZI|nr:hypothetical protein NA57DRAFT_53563 [Rhizodiscina lignyota]